MTRSYRQTLELVRSEYETTEFALSHLINSWNTAKVIKEAGERSLTDFQRAALHLEVTYIVRLFATFEGLLKLYLDDHHTEVTSPNNPKVGWFVDFVARKQSPPISTHLKAGVNKVRDCRNDLMHTGRVTAPSITFDEALSNLGKFLDKLPDPR
ncbi:MAG: hypothetical protein JWL77_1907 [Chthonomonadaceae bacterium]|nr:hypothetical protein [Chthonomonadaceae bacterium]